MLHLILLLFVVATASAQPLEGPFEVLNTYGTAALTNPRVAVRNDSTADLFWQTADTVFHMAVSLQNGQSTSGLNYFPDPVAGRHRTLQRVASGDSGWAAITYDRDTNQNVTNAFLGLDSISQIHELDQGYNYQGQYSWSSEHSAFALGTAPQNRFLAAWQDSWYHWLGNFGCGGCGPAVVEFDFDNGVLRTNEVGFGHCGYTEAYSAIHALCSDTVLLITTGDGGISVEVALGMDDGFFLTPGSYFFDCGTNIIEFCVTRGRNGLALAGGIAPRLLSLPALASCLNLLNLDSDPIASASHPDFGIAWLARYGTGLVLYRADTTGSLIFPAGAIHWPSEGYEIIEAALSLSDDGLLVAAWTERETEYDWPTILRIASVGWDTYLEADDSDVILHPSSFILSIYPNPFNSVLQIEYEHTHRSELDLAVYNLLGQRVETLQHGVQEAGKYRAKWLPKSAGGIYFVTLRKDGSSQTAKVLYLR